MLTLGDNFSYQGAKPLDARLKYDTLAAMKAVGDATMYDGCLAYCTATDKTYQWKSTNSVDADTGKWREFSSGSGGVSSYDDLTDKPTINDVELSGNKTTSDLGLQDVVQFSTMPSATADILGKIVQYIGATANGYTHGYYYECVTDGSAYSWEKLDVQNVPEPIQVDTLPTASASNVGKIYQYIGSTTQDYTNGYFYKCVSDGEDPATYSWEEVAVQPGGSGGGSTTKAITAAVEVGGIDVGTSYPVGTDLEDILSDMLEPTLYPSFTAPSASLTYGANQYYAVGGTVSALTATVALNRGTINPAYGTSGYRSGAASGYAISTSGADTEYSDTSTSSGSFSVPTLTRATKGTIVVTGTASYAAGEQPKDSKGGDYDSPLAAGSVTATKTLTFIQPYYYGASNSATIANFTGLTESVTAKGQKTFSFTTSNQYQVFAYDSSYGNLKSILDPNGFETISGWTKSTVTVNGFSYFVYVTNSQTTDTNAAFTFKY